MYKARQWSPHVCIPMGSETTEKAIGMIHGFSWSRMEQADDWIGWDLSTRKCCFFGIAVVWTGLDWCWHGSGTLVLVIVSSTIFWLVGLWNQGDSLVGFFIRIAIRKLLTGHCLGFSWWTSGEWCTELLHERRVVNNCMDVLTAHTELVTRRQKRSNFGWRP